MPIPLQPGQVIKGKYRVDRLLGEGGMGVVVAGHHVGLAQRCAIKFLHTAMLAHPEVVERFAREARAASRLESDHVARVTDVDCLEDGTPFMVMEYLEGTDLSTVRASGQPLALHVAVSYVLEACEAFAEAHTHGIVHRDIKPANLFLARRAGGRTRIKVLDFGISKMGGGDGEAGVTKTSSVMGSAHYMSPEQMLTPREVDLRTDIWALGVTLFELTTAQLPFPGESVTQVCAMVMSQAAPAPSSVRAELPPAFDAVVRRCLARQAHERFKSVTELAGALSPLAREPAPVPIRSPSDSLSDGGTAPPSVAAHSALHGSTASIAPMEADEPTATRTMPSRHAAHDRTSAMGGDPPSATAVPVSNTTLTLTQARHGRTTWALAALGALGLVASVATLVVARRAPSSTVASAPAAAASSSVVGDSTLSPTAEPASSSTARPTVTPSSQVVISATASPARSPMLNKAPLQAPAVRPSASAPKKPPASCSPPFILDAQGMKRAKPECM